jgi:hypothetical protein
MNRRGFLAGLGAALVAPLAAPAIVRAASLMAISPLPPVTVEVGTFNGLAFIGFTQELAEITRRAFVPKLIPQIYAGSPTIALLTAPADRHPRILHARPGGTR